MDKVMLSFDKVNAHYGKIQALHDVSLHINQGEIVTLIGANGAGKTTLLGTLCGDPRATSGRIVFDGKDITDWQTAKIMREAVAIVPEGRRVFSRMTVEENLAMGGFFAEREQFQTRIKRVYDLFPRLFERRIQRAGTMSGGEQQMLAIGRALMSQPRLLLLDEPSLGLAPIIIQQIFDTIEQLRSEGMTIFLVEQNANQALKLADRGYVLENGRVVLEDTGDALLANEAVRSAYLGGGAVCIARWRYVYRAYNSVPYVGRVRRSRHPAFFTYTPSHNYHPPDALLSYLCKQTVIFLSFEHVMLPREHKTRDIAHPAQ